MFKEELMRFYYWKNPKLLTGYTPIVPEVFGTSRLSDDVSKIKYGQNTRAISI